MKHEYMKRAIELAQMGEGKVNPNPLVGSVIVKNGKIIGEGYHMCYGEAHAEVNAFLNATEDVEGAEMYVTLEPCSHYGKTPPCALKIIEKKIKHVYISQLDPNPLVSGRGVKLLEDAGITVESGILEAETKKQNEIFLKYIQHKIPFVTLKYAMTLDGKIATSTKDSKWITNEKSRRFVHDLRHQHMAILVGVQTVIEDDPMLDTRRDVPSRNPIRVIIDPSLRIPVTARVVQTAVSQKTIIATSNQVDLNKKSMLESLGVDIMTFDTAHDIDFKELLIRLGQAGIDSLLVEGGAYTHGHLLDLRLFDKVYAFIAPKLIGGQGTSPITGQGVSKMQDAIQLKNIKIHTFDDDLCVEGYYKP